MTTTITPGTGAAPLFVQQGIGASPGYSAIDLRRSDSLGLQEGVYSDTDFMVVQRAAGANMSVDITMTAGGFACVQGDSTSGQGLYTVPVHSATINETIAAANGSNPRIDIVILEILDNVHDVSGGNRAQVRVVAGTATAGATLANRTGAPALPSSALLLADVLVGTAVTTIPNTVIRDRRKWCRGAYLRTIKTDGNVSATSVGFATITGTAVRLECSGAAVKVTASVRLDTPATAGVYMFVAPIVDSVLPTADVGTTGDLQGINASAAVVQTLGGTFQWTIVPAAGSRTIGLGYHITSGTGTIWAGAGIPLVFTVEELIRQNIANNNVTSG